MDNRFWSVLFGVTMVACLVGFAISPLMGWWMPDGISTHAGDVDFLFYVILWITTFFFILTEAILIAFMWMYVSTPEGKPPVSATTDVVGFLKPLTSFLHNQHRVELAWTLIPAAILLYIAFAQVNTWANIKYESRKKHQQDQVKEGAALQVGVSARQFEWRMRYPSVARFKRWMSKGDWEAGPKDKIGVKADFDSFGRVPQADDIYTVNELHIWQHHQVVVHLTTRDVIHSFNLPNFRVKQDALPGKMIPVWFRSVDPKVRKTMNTKWDEKRGRYLDGINPDTGDHDNAFVYDIACAELCGWGHYRMIGRVFVHENQEDFLRWLEHAEKYNRQRTADR